MSDSNDFDRARQFAEQALDGMAKRRIVPTPQNFAVWFAHLSGAHPEVSQAIEALDAARSEFTFERNADLYQRLIGDTQSAAQLREAGERISTAVAVVLDLLQKAGSGNKRYGEALGQASEAMEEEGANAERLKLIVEAILDETQRMVKQNEEFVAKLAESAREIEFHRRQAEDARRETLLDALTGVGNRKLFDVRLRECMRVTTEDGAPLALLMADIDHFKRFNDTYGHQLGDHVLRLVARTLTDGIKGRDVAARYGGEEFAILLPKTRLEDAATVANQLRTLIGSRHLRKRDEGRDLGSVTLSLGVACFRPGEAASDFVERADSALYLAKHAGRNRVCTERDLETAPAAAAAAKARARAKK